MKTSLRYRLHSGKNSKIAYYIRQASRCAVPKSVLHRHLDKILVEGDRKYRTSDVRSRIEYYNRLADGTQIGAGATRLGDFALRGNSSTYFFDSYEFTRWFDDDLLWHYLFGDITHIPEYPSILKSRPIAGDNANSVLLNLDKCRHFVFLKDRIPFEKKADMAIFRGSVKDNENRIRFIEKFDGSPRVDASNTISGGGGHSVSSDSGKMAPRISLYDHLKFKYIMALEGNDVASNLKWIMSSSSIAVTPRMRYETWYMEGRLIPDVHYIEIKPDFSDLEERMDYYSSHPKLAREIIGNANEYTRQFLDPELERYISLSVLRRYFEATGQISG